jgi:hypothetical protein
VDRSLPQPTQIDQVVVLIVQGEKFEPARRRPRSRPGSQVLKALGPCHCNAAELHYPLHSLSGGSPIAACKLCSLDPQTVETAFASGASDRAIAKRFNISAMSVGRHRRLHLLRVAQDRVTLLTKDREARAERQELTAAAASDTPSTQAMIEATIGLRRQMEKLVEVEERLSRVATKAEKDRAHGAVAQVAGAQLRSLEYGSRLAGHPGFTPRAIGGGGETGERFSIVINLGPEQTVSINATPMPQPAQVIEGEATERSEAIC